MNARLRGPWVSVLCTTMACSTHAGVQGSNDAVGTPDASAASDDATDAPPTMPEEPPIDPPPGAPDAGIDDAAGADARVRIRSIDPRRSLAITDQPILARFPLRRVMEQLAAQSQVAGLTSLALFHQWWDTQNPPPGMTDGPHCDGMLNGFPYACRPVPGEGSSASCDPYASDDSPCAYMPTGLFNRFDLAPTSGAHCGEYRIAYAKRTGLGTTDDRGMMIIEAILPNPRPDLGIEGCRPIAELWADLSEIDDVAARADALEAIYFTGVAGLPPVIDVTHLGDNAMSAGQLRTNQFSNVAPWSLREYRLVRTCAGGTCTSMRVVPATNKTNPYGPLFAPGNDAAIAQDFRRVLPGQVASLAAASLVEIGMVIPDRFNSGQSAQTSMPSDSNYASHFATGGALRAAIAAELTRLGSSLTPENIIARAQTQSCSGCHHYSSGMDLGGGMRWPRSFDFTHVSERVTEMAGGVTRHALSPAMVEVFLPHRKGVLERYLNGTMEVRLTARGSGTLGGSTTH
jgi:hypothetical protein